MFGKLFGKKGSVQVPKKPYTYRNTLVLNWSTDSDGWVAPILQLDKEAQIYIGPEHGDELPKDTSCDSIINALNNIYELIEQAKHYLINELNKSSHFKDNKVLESNLKSTGIEIFEHEKTPNEYSLTFDPEFDPGAICRVRFKNGTPYSWGIDD